MMFMSVQCSPIGDGEPDEDFPALDTKRQLKQFGNMNEFCLCRNSEPLPKGNRTSSSPAPTSGMTSSSAFSAFASTTPSGRDRLDTSSTPVLSSRGSIIAPHDPKVWY